MKLVIDTNILISALINPKSKIANLILKESETLELFTPHYLFSEIIDKTDKILKITNYSNSDFRDLLQIFIKRISLIDEDVISTKVWEAAYELTSTVDENDVAFVALAIHLDAFLWTGDLKLYRGLMKKGFNQLKLTKEIIY